jgi:hypothetical protein
MDRKDLRALSRVRLSEARALLKAELPDGAYYLAGYAVECALKACIAKETQRYEFPDKKRVNSSHTHDDRSDWRQKSRGNEMGQALLVNIDLAAGAEILRIVEEAGVKVSVALWVKLEEYNSWRLLISSRRFDAAGPGKASSLVFDALVAADFPVEKTPAILILPTTDPTVRGLRRYFGKVKGLTVEGRRIGGQRFGNRWVEDGYVYRVS